MSYLDKNTFEEVVEGLSKLEDPKKALQTCWDLAILSAAELANEVVGMENPMRRDETYMASDIREAIFMLRSKEAKNGKKS